MRARARPSRVRELTRPRTTSQGFPRFCFLSNDELLEILAQSRNFQAVQPHLIKCFDNIKGLDFGAAAPGSIDVTGMISSEGEQVPFTKPMKARGAVEEWMSRVELSMQSTLHKPVSYTHLTLPTICSV